MQTALPVFLLRTTVNVLFFAADLNTHWLEGVSLKQFIFVLRIISNFALHFLQVFCLFLFFKKVSAEWSCARDRAFKCKIVFFSSIIKTNYQLLHASCYQTQEKPHTHKTKVSCDDWWTQCTNKNWALHSHTRTHICAETTELASH